MLRRSRGLSTTRSPQRSTRICRRNWSTQKILAQQIDFLGGKPTVKVPDVPDVSDGVAALRADVDLERRQLDRYRKRVAEANDLGLPDVAEALRPLLQQTQDHVRELEDALQG